MKYIVYATGNHGDGLVQKIAEIDDPTELEIYIGLFAKDVVISIEESMFSDKPENEAF